MIDMTIPYIAGWGDTIKQTVPQIGEAVRTFINPKWREEEAFKAAVMHDPTLIEKFAKLNQDNPDAFAQIYGPNVQRQISALKLSPEQQLQRTVTTATAQAVSENPADVGRVQAGLPRKPQAENEALNLDEGRAKVDERIKLQGDIQLAQAVRSKVGNKELYDAVKREDTELKVGFGSVSPGAVHEILYENDAGYRSFVDSEEVKVQRSADAKVRAEFSTATARSDLQRARDQMRPKLMAMGMGSGVTVDDYLAATEGTFSGPEYAGEFKATPEGTSRVRAYLDREAEYRGLDKNKEFRNELRALDGLRVALSKAKDGNGREAVQAAIASKANVINDMYAAVGSSFRVDANGDVVKYDEAGNVIARMAPQAFWDFGPKESVPIPGGSSGRASSNVEGYKADTTFNAQGTMVDSLAPPVVTFSGFDPNWADKVPADNPRGGGPSRLIKNTRPAPPARPIETQVGLNTVRRPLTKEEKHKVEFVAQAADFYLTQLKRITGIGIMNDSPEVRAKADKFAEEFFTSEEFLSYPKDVQEAVKNKIIAGLRSK